MIRRRILVAGLSGVAALAIAATAAAAAFADDETTSVPVSYAGEQDSLTHDCVRTAIAQGIAIPNPDSWRAGAQIGIGSAKGFLVIRDDKDAAVCSVEKGKTAGLVGGFDGTSRHNYDNLTADRPFDYLSAVNYPGKTIVFGIATGDVASLSLIGPNQSVTPSTPHDGTFIAVTKFGEDSEVPATNHVKATLTDGEVVTGQLRK
jgi:hypothetical protein